MTKTLILGSPGTGKTTALLAEVNRAFVNGVQPNRVAFLAFTRIAAEEARLRAEKLFSFSARDLPHFRTIHSLVFRELGLRRSDVIGDEHLAELGEAIGELEPDEEGITRRSADPLLTVDHYARTTGRTLREAWEDHGGKLDWFRLLRFSEAYARYKSERGLFDFTDMLQAYVTSAPAPLELDLAIVDEAQDLTHLQWAAADHAFKKAKHVIAAGDDDQALFSWSGADAARFMNLPYEPSVLPLAHRLPAAIFDLAQGVAQRIDQRYAKPCQAGRAGGAVNWLAGPEEADLSAGTWLLLARTRAQLHELTELARSRGVVYRVRGKSSVNSENVRAIQAHEALRAGREVTASDAILVLRMGGGPHVERHLDERGGYTAAMLGYGGQEIWHDALKGIPLDEREYYLACMRRGEKLTAPPRVRVETIHGAKGAEAEHVLLPLDISYRVHLGREIDPDAENRVLYVGLTRASVSLNLVAPRTAYGYQL